MSWSSLSRLPHELILVWIAHEWPHPGCSLFFVRSSWIAWRLYSFVVLALRMLSFKRLWCPKSSWAWLLSLVWDALCYCKYTPGQWYSNGHQHGMTVSVLLGLWTLCWLLSSTPYQKQVRSQLADLERDSLLSSTVQSTMIESTSVTTATGYALSTCGTVVCLVLSQHFATDTVKLMANLDWAYSNCSSSLHWIMCLVKLWMCSIHKNGLYFVFVGYIWLPS